MSIPTLDLIVYSAFAVIAAICTVPIVFAVRAYIVKTGAPNPRRFTFRAAMRLAVWKANVRWTWTQVTAR